jgi:hypothetical protein
VWKTKGEAVFSMLAPAGVVSKLNEVARRVMLKLNVTFNDRFFVVHSELGSLQRPCDIHFHPNGSRALAENDWEVILDSLNLAKSRLDQIEKKEHFRESTTTRPPPESNERKKRNASEIFLLAPEMVCAASLAIAKASNCPSNRWQYAIHEQLQRTHMSYINIGANSGSNVNEFLNIYNQTWNVSARLWHEQTQTGCGVCSACSASRVPTLSKKVAKSPDSIHVVAVELITSTFLALHKHFASLKCLVKHCTPREEMHRVLHTSHPHLRVRHVTGGGSLPKRFGSLPKKE